MRVHQPGIMRSLILVVMTNLMAMSGFGQTPSRDLLNHLEGIWRMKGTVMKKPVEYIAEGVWALHHQFLSLHMKDVAVPPAYEASLYIGIDSSKNQYVAHWLDSFGGAGSRVVGLGTLSPERIEVIYTYAERKCRNVFTYSSDKDEWALAIDSEGTEGDWSPFARYTIVRKK